MKKAMTMLVKNFGVCRGYSLSLVQKLRAHKYTFVAVLFITGFLGGAALKVVARETIMIGYDDYTVVPDVYNTQQTYAQEE